MWERECTSHRRSEFRQATCTTRGRGRAQTPRTALRAPHEHDTRHRRGVADGRGKASPTRCGTRCGMSVARIPLSANDHPSAGGNSTPDPTLRHPTSRAGPGMRSARRPTYLTDEQVAAATSCDSDTRASRPHGDRSARKRQTNLLRRRRESDPRSGFCRSRYAVSVRSSAFISDQFVPVRLDEDQWVRGRCCRIVVRTKIADPPRRRTFKVSREGSRVPSLPARFPFFAIKTAANHRRNGPNYGGRTMSIVPPV